jgi:hypothetical protein
MRIVMCPRLLIYSTACTPPPPYLQHRREISGVVASVCSHIIVLLHFAFLVWKALVLLNHGAWIA